MHAKGAHRLSSGTVFFAVVDVVGDEDKEDPSASQRVDRSRRARPFWRSQEQSPCATKEFCFWGGRASERGVLGSLRKSGTCQTAVFSDDLLGFISPGWKIPPTPQFRFSRISLLLCILSIKPTLRLEYGPSPRERTTWDAIYIYETHRKSVNPP